MPDLIDQVYGEDAQHLTRPPHIEGKAILCPKHTDVNAVNDMVLSRIPKPVNTIYIGAI